MLRCLLSPNGYVDSLQSPGKSRDFLFFFVETNKRFFLFFETGDAKDLEEPKLLQKEVGGVILPDFKS